MSTHNRQGADKQKYDEYLDRILNLEAEAHEQLYKELTALLQNAEDPDIKLRAAAQLSGMILRD